MKIIELRQKLAKLTTDQRAMLDAAEGEKRGLNAEEQVKYDAMDGEYLDTLRSINRLEELEKREADLAKVAYEREAALNSPNPAVRSKAELDERRGLALQGFLSVGRRDLTAEQRSAMSEFRIDPAQREISLVVEKDYRAVKQEYRALSVGTTTAGGYTVPQGFVSNLEMALLAFGGVRRVASVIRTDAGNPLPWPTMNDTSNKGERLAEQTTFGASVDPTFGQVTFNAYKYSSKPVIVSSELLQDSAFNLASLMGDILGERIGRIQSDEFTTGTGSSQPQGIVTGSTLGKTAASATAIAADELLDLIHSVDPAYRELGPAFMFHDNILLALRKLKDTTNQYLIQPRITDMVPQTIHGYPFVINQSMQSSIATGTKTVLFGLLSKFQIRDVNEVRLLRLNELFAQTDQVGFVMFMRSDSKMLNAGTNPVKHIIQA